MLRRDFLKVVGASMAARGVHAGAHSGSTQTDGPKIMLFGFAIISGDQQSLQATMPKAGQHAIFLVGRQSTLKALSAGSKLIRALDAGLDEGHDDMGLPNEYAACFAAPRLTVGTGSSQIDAGLSDHLPSVTAVANQIDSTRSQHTLSAMPPGTLVVSLNGGRLRMPGKPSNNKGTHGIPWQFNFKSNPVGRDYLLTDLLVYHCRETSVTLTAGSASTALGAGERLWIVNVPTEMQDDKDTADVIAHAHEWFSLVSPSLPGSPDDVSVRAKKRFTRDKSTRVRFVHPCADPKVISRKYFPPDSDPCFIVMA